FGLVPGPAEASLAPKDKYLTFHHMALEVNSVDDLFKAREFLTQHGIEFVFEGRRGAGCNVSLEVRDPDGYMIELTCEMEQRGSRGRAKAVAIKRRRPTRLPSIPTTWRRWCGHRRRQALTGRRSAGASTAASSAPTGANSGGCAPRGGPGSLSRISG